MPQEKTALIPSDQKKGLIRSKEDEVLLEKISCFREENQRNLQKWHEDIEKKTTQRFFLELCRNEFSITWDHLKTLNDKELRRLGKIITEKITAWARFQTTAGHVVLWGPILAGLFLAFSVSLDFFLISVFSLFSIPIFLAPARNYRKTYLKIVNQYGEENFPLDFLEDTHGQARGTLR